MTGPDKAKRKSTRSRVRRNEEDYEFDSLKDYVDDIIDQVEERLIALEKRASLTFDIVAFSSGPRNTASRMS